MTVQTAIRHKRGGLYLRGFRPRRGRRASLHAHRDADGQHAVLQHDAQSAAAAYRPAFLRAGDRMGPAADELAVHARPDDRHVGQRPHRRHHDRQSRHVRGEISASAVRRRHRARHDRNHRQARIEIAAPAPASSSFITAPTTRTTSSSPNAAARLLCACGRSDAQGGRRQAFRSCGPNNTVGRELTKAAFCPTARVIELPL